jgi:hypothetical protein
MFLVDIQQDFNLSRFCTGDPVEVLKDIFTQETSKQSKEFQVHIERIPVLDGKERIA